MSIILKLLFIFLSVNVKATTLKISEYTSIEGQPTCILLDSINLTDNGYISWNFKRYNYSGCRDARVTFAKSSPPNLLRGARGLEANII